MIGAMHAPNNDARKFLFSVMGLNAGVLKCKVCLFEFNTSLQHGKFFKTLHTYKDKTLLFCVIVTQIKKRKVILPYSPVPKFIFNFMYFLGNLKVCIYNCI